MEKPTQHCKAIILQLKTNTFKKKIKEQEGSLWQHSTTTTTKRSGKKKIMGK